MRSTSVRDGQRGEGKLAFFITIIVIGSLAFCTFKMAPSYFANYQLQDAITTEARFATSTYPKKSPDDIQEDVAKKIKELGVQAKKEDVKVTTDGSLVTPRLGPGRDSSSTLSASAGSSARMLACSSAWSGWSSG